MFLFRYPPNIWLFIIQILLIIKISIYCQERKGPQRTTAGIPFSPSRPAQSFHASILYFHSKEDYKSAAQVALLPHLLCFTTSYPTAYSALEIGPLLPSAEGDGLMCHVLMAGIWSTAQSPVHFQWLWAQ
jgi:hypothetical protein